MFCTIFSQNLSHIMLQIVLDFFMWSCDIDKFYMVSLAQPCVGTGETLVLAHKYCITNVLSIII